MPDKSDQMGAIGLATATTAALIVIVALILVAVRQQPIEGTTVTTPDVVYNYEGSDGIQLPDPTKSVDVVIVAKAPLITEGDWREQLDSIRWVDVAPLDTASVVLARCRAPSGYCIKPK